MRLFTLLLIFLPAWQTFGQTTGALNDERYRVIISSDIGGDDEDDIQSFIHYLVYSDRFDTEGPRRMTAVVYRDYFRTAPYARIVITPEALRVPSDRRAVAGHEKQFGLLAEEGGRLVPVTDFAVRYGQWAGFDAIVGSKRLP